MQVNNIQTNTAFQGKIVNNEHLQKAMDYASNRQLKKFEKLLQKMEASNDSWTYSLQTQQKFDYDSCNTTQQLILSSNSLNCMNFRTIGIETVNRMLEPFHDKAYNKALKKVCSCIEDDYRQAEINKPRETILERINKLLSRS